jgi:hypothetical protein
MRNAALLCVVLAGASAQAEPARIVLHHTGRLLTGEDQPADGAHTLTFRLWASDVPLTDEQPVWEQAFAVTVVRGVYAVDLGDTAGGKAALDETDLPYGAARFLSVSVDGEADMTPRLRVGSVPHALWADRVSRADSAAVADEVTCAGCVAANEINPAGFKAPEATSADSAKDLACATPPCVSAGEIDTAGLKAPLAGLADSAKDLLCAAPPCVGATEIDRAGLDADLVDGLHADGFAQLNPNAPQQGGLELTGGVTASAFFGDGSALTGIEDDTKLPLSGGALTGKLSIMGSVKLGNDTEACPGTGDAKLGAIRWTGAAFEGCTASGWSAFGSGSQGTQSNPGRSCQTIRLLNPGAGSDVYWIKPGTTAFQVYCDMVEDGGGWTLVFLATNKAGVIEAWPVGDTAAMGQTPFTPTSNGRFKLSDNDINALRNSGLANNLRVMIRIGTTVLGRSFHPTACAFQHNYGLAAGDICNKSTRSGPAATDYTQSGHAGMLSRWYVDAGFGYISPYIHLGPISGGTSHGSSLPPTYCTYHDSRTCPSDTSFEVWAW